MDPVLTKVLEGKGTVGFRDLQALLKRLGFALVRIKGSHHIYEHPKATRPLNVQPRGSEAKRYQVNQLRDMIKEFELLDDR